MPEQPPRNESTDRTSPELSASPSHGPAQGAGPTPSPRVPPLQRETLLMVNDRGKLGLLMVVAALGGVGVGFGLSMLAHDHSCPVANDNSHSSGPPPALPALRVAPAPTPPRVFGSPCDRAERRKMLGVYIADTEDGVVVTEVFDGFPADRAGFRSGDLVVEYEGEPIEQVRELQRKVRKTRRGKKVHVLVLRDGEKRTLTPTL